MTREPGEAPEGHAPNPADGVDRDAWDAGGVRSLRGHLRASQTELAARLGTRQQTVSEWETGVSRPRRMSRRLLRLVAEESGFYEAGPAPAAGAEGGQESAAGAAP
ncbi:MAG: helix-turn-helix transcriptional regulator [Chloroflexi bacterium]|nr:helix-turn-helix transcriptional regulator [Chloroflexota bacterium]MDA1004720.1 helix-turn-helix transcriptional regulator [Chloroflexota bacterium]